MPDGKVGHDAFAVIRETIRSMNKVAIGRVVLTNREHIIALEPLEKGLMGTLLRYPYEVRSEKEYFDDIQDVKITKDMLDLARHIVEFVLGDLDIGVGVDLVALHDVVGRDFLASIGVDLGVFDAVAGLAVDLVEGNLLGVRRRRIKGDRTGHEGKTQKTLPIGAGGHGLLRKNATNDQQGYHRMPPSQTRRGGESRNGVNCRTAPFCGRPATFWPLLPSGTAQRVGTSLPIMRCFNRRCRSIRWHYRHLLEEVPMATQRHGQIVETPTEARQAEPGPSVLALLTVSTGLAVLILGIVWFVFFRT